ncbi:phosphatase 2C [Musa troglodytarum]|uniref:protein-serine/threonine phosphatase n=1 Tax=Musa troglodytarum TaxID=320322 RepID=A0A9E7K3Z0_9LILI|nr:phosphatase 2C [Musa troglodytarum]URE05543.1 phosphatase 2C [Musa troglodytarum]URE05544.1 phosphatase 2C [Musa troglodytarum]
MDKMRFLRSCCSWLAGPSLTVGKGRNSQGRIRVSYGFSLLKGAAAHPIEDYHVAKFIHISGQELGLFAVFDGHLGDSVPAYLEKHLFANIINEEEFWTHPDIAIRRAYEKTDNEILSQSRDLGRGGSTAVTAVLVNGTKLWIANVGDSRAVLAKSGEIIQMSTDHEPDSERERIETRGGFVSNMPGDVARVNGQLAVSRAFGDKNLKTLLSSDPDIQVEDTSSETELLILASDGLWKVMSNEEAVNLARKTKNPLAAAKQLTLEAFNRDSKDDISCIVVRFKG